MGRYIARRLILTIPTLLGAFVLIFMLTRLVPGDPVLVVLAEHYTRDSYEAVQRELGLDRPIWEQLGVSLFNTIRGDFGTSFQNNRPVAVNILPQLRFTIELTIAALVVSVVIGVPAGIIAALRHNRWPDFAAMVGALVALCAPNFWLGIIFLLIFSLWFGWFPSFGVGDSRNPITVLSHLALPALTLGTAGAGLVARVMRSSMLEVLSQDYVQTARAKGLAERIVVYRHAMRNALIPVVTIVGLEAITLLTGTVIVETVFARPGIGRLLIDAILTRDYPQIQALLLLFVIIAVVINVLVDVSYGFIDPRIRYD